MTEEWRDKYVTIWHSHPKSNYKVETVIFAMSYCGARENEEGGALESNSASTQTTEENDEEKSGMQINLSS